MHKSKNIIQNYPQDQTHMAKIRKEYFCSTFPLFEQHQESNRLHSWAFNRLQYRQNILEDIRQQNIKKLQQNSLQ